MRGSVENDKETHGNGDMASDRNASREVAHWYPSVVYTATISSPSPGTCSSYLLCSPNNGNTAPNVDRKKLFAANALAA